MASKSSIHVVALLTTAAAAVAVSSYFVFPYFTNPVESYTYRELIAETGFESLETDVRIIGGGLLLSVLSAWIIYARPLNFFATLFRFMFVSGAFISATFSVLALYVAGFDGGPTFMELIQEEEHLNWGFGAWTIAGTSIVTFVLSVIMCFVVIGYRRNVRLYGIETQLDPDK